MAEDIYNPVEPEAPTWIESSFCSLTFYGFPDEVAQAKKLLLEPIANLTQLRIFVSQYNETEQKIHFMIQIPGPEVGNEVLHLVYDILDREMPRSTYHFSINFARQVEENEDEDENNEYAEEMMSRAVRCPICGDLVDKDDLVLNVTAEKWTCPACTSKMKGKPNV